MLQKLWVPFRKGWSFAWNWKIWWWWTFLHTNVYINQQRVSINILLFRLFRTLLLILNESSVCTSWDGFANFHFTDLGFGPYQRFLKLSWSLGEISKRHSHGQKESDCRYTFVSTTLTEASERAYKEFNCTHVWLQVVHSATIPPELTSTFTRKLLPETAFLKCEMNRLHTIVVTAIRLFSNTS